MDILGFLRDFFNTRSTGAFLDPEDHRDINVRSYRPLADNLPSSFITDISMIPVQDQKALGSCAGQAIGAEVDYRIFKATGKVDPQSSKRFLYAMAKAVDGQATVQGTYPRLIYKIDTSDGSADCLVVPNDNTLNHSQYISVPRSSAVLQNAKINLMTGFATVDPDLTQIKQGIVDSGVLTATVRYYAPAWNTGNLGPIKGQPGQFHRIMLYGYQDVDNDTRILFRNSWGDKWGNGGNGSFLWSDYQNDLFDIWFIDQIPAEIIKQARQAPYIFKKTIAFGSSGEEVLQLQLHLQRQGFYQLGWNYLTGYFGNITREALLNYQIKRQVAPLSELYALNGRLAGNKTIAMLNNDNKIKLGLEDAIIQVESGGDNQAVGDKGLPNMAYGCMQIRQPYVDDVNRVFGTSYKASDTLGDEKLSRWIFEKYMEIYATPARLGRPVTDQDKARIHNGGPNGWKTAGTVAYWNKVRLYM